MADRPFESDGVSLVSSSTNMLLTHRENLRAILDDWTSKQDKILHRHRMLLEGLFNCRIHDYVKLDESTSSHRAVFPQDLDSRVPTECESTETFAKQFQGDMMHFMLNSQSAEADVDDVDDHDKPDEALALNQIAISAPYANDHSDIDRSPKAGGPSPRFKLAKSTSTIGYANEKHRQRTSAVSQISQATSLFRPSLMGKSQSNSQIMMQLQYTLKSQGSEEGRWNTKIDAPKRTVLRHSDLADAFELVTQADNETEARPSRLALFVKSVVFNTFSASMILANAVIVSVETEYEAAHLATHDVLTVSNWVLNIWYFIEVSLKIMAFRTEYFTGPECKVNALDSILVCISVVDMVFSSNYNMARLFRSIRLIRIVRNVRIFEHLTFSLPFQKMITALLACVGTLIWSLFIFAFVTWGFAVCLTQMATSARLRAQEKGGAVDLDALASVQGYFGNIGVGMYCLLQSVTNGKSWGLMSDSLLEVDALALFFYLSYILFTVFGVLNVVTSVFVDSALQTSMHYRDLLVADKKVKREIYETHMRKIYDILDDDGSGLLTIEEVERIFDDPHLKEFIDALEVNACDARMLFQLLDFDGSHQISFEEFCEGCVKLKGEAKSFDVYCLLYSTERNMKLQTTFMEYTMELFQDIQEHLTGHTDAIAELKALSCKDPQIAPEIPI